ncbi:protein chibby homolog 1-like [Engystomops pustulosus]|uniref:protein chibby homolog 1-like n=1 Tax=Engystomops pustulosus TaxID=76066 RepID=UPI003AFB226C
MVKNWFFDYIISRLPSYKFRPKKAPRRKATSATSFNHLNQCSRTVDLGPPRVQLRDQMHLFVNGQWITDGSSLEKLKNQVSLTVLEERNKILEVENNHLKIQIMVLKDILLEAIPKEELSQLDIGLLNIE